MNKRKTVQKEKEYNILYNKIMEDVICTFQLVDFFMTQYSIENIDAVVKGINRYREIVTTSFFADKMKKAEILEAVDSELKNLFEFKSILQKRIKNNKIIDQAVITS